MADLNNVLSQVLQQLDVISQRLNAIESTNNASTNGPANTNSTAMTATLSTPVNRANSFPTSQHGIRAQGLWRNKEFVLNREPTKYSFKFENAKDYTVWSFTTLRVMEKEGLSSFILGTLPEPRVPANDSSHEENWLYSRWFEFDSAAMSAILNCVGKAQLSLLMRCTTSSEMWVRLRDTYLLSLK